MNSRARYKRRRLMQHIRDRKDLLFYLKEAAIIVRGVRFVRTPYYAKAKQPDFPMKPVLINTTRIITLRDRQVVLDSISKRIINPFRIPFGEVGKSRNTPSQMRARDQRKHEYVRKDGITQGDTIEHGMECIITNKRQNTLLAH